MDLGAAGSAPGVSADRTRASLQSFQDRVFEISEGIRGISHRLHPSIVDTLGLSASLGALCRDFLDHEGVRVGFHSETLPDDMPAEIASCLYRVTQEALRNISKHARAEKVNVSVGILNRAVQLQIIDSGIGFDTRVTTAGLGLQSMRERVMLVSGTFSIESDRNLGTRIHVDIPLTDPAKALAGNEGETVRAYTDSS
jgi:signal transduction histidine kinase